MSRPWGSPVLVLAGYAVLAAILPLADDELYYWTWSKDLQLSYYDHPAAVAVLIRASTMLFGDTPLGVRFPACVCSVVTLLVIERLMRPSRAIFLLLLTPLFSLGAMLITPDAPLQMCWALYLFWMVRAQESLAQQSRISVKLWLIGGVILGCGVLSKYTMALAVPAGFATFLLAKVSWRRWLAGYVGHGLVSAVVVAPIWVFNMQHDWKPLLFQWRHSLQGATAGGWFPFAEFLGVQMILVGTGPVVLLPWILKNVGRWRSNTIWRSSFCFFVLPFAFFLFKALKARLEGNWAIVSYVGFWPLFAVWLENCGCSWKWRGFTYAGFLPPAVAMLILGIHLLAPLPMLRPEADRIHRQSAWLQVAREVGESLHNRHEPLPVYAATYQMVSRLRWCGIEALQIDGLTRPSHFTQAPHQPSETDRCYVIHDQPLPPEFSHGFSPPVLVEEFPLVVRGVVVDRVLLWKYEKAINSPVNPK